MQIVQLPFALKDGVIKHIDNVRNGIECDCICPKCKNKLIAKNQGEYRTHHFAHTDNTDCRGAIETAVHKAAKQIICNSKEILTPNFEANYERKEYFSKILFERFQKYSAQNFKYNVAEDEKVIRDYRVDVFISNSIIPINIEITVTSETRKNKILDFTDHNELLFEIDLRDWIKKDIKKDEFTDAVLNLSENRRWLVERSDINHIPDRIKKESEIFFQQTDLFYKKNKDRSNQNDLDYHLKQLAPIEKKYYNLFLDDIKKLKKSLNMDWRKERLKTLRKKSNENLFKIINQIEEGSFNQNYLKPVISNVWIVETHSYVWQYELSNRFIIETKRENFYLQDVIFWFNKNYDILPFIKRLNNLNNYNVWNLEGFEKILDEVYVNETNSIDHLPSTFKVIMNYLESLVREGILRNELSKFIIVKKF